jgi:hypothetical protein
MGASVVRVGNTVNTKGLRQKLIHETREFLDVFLFLAPFVISFAIYQSYLTIGEADSLFVYGAALVNALVLSKIILIGELLGLGRRSEAKPLIVPSLHKAVVFSLFYLSFRGLEETARLMFHGLTLSRALNAAFIGDKKELVTRALVMSFAAIPFFALRETRRVLGANRFYSLFFRGGPLDTHAMHEELTTNK